MWVSQRNAHICDDNNSMVSHVMGYSIVHRNILPIEQKQRQLPLILMFDGFYVYLTEPGVFVSVLYKMLSNLRRIYWRTAMRNIPGHIWGRHSHAHTIYMLYTCIVQMYLEQGKWMSHNFLMWVRPRALNTTIYLSGPGQTIFVLHLISYITAWWYGAAHICINCTLGSCLFWTHTLLLLLPISYLTKCWHKTVVCVPHNMLLNVFVQMRAGLQILYIHLNTMRSYTAHNPPIIISTYIEHCVEIVKCYVI